MLEPASAAGTEVAARRVDAGSARLDELGDDAFGKAALDLRDPGTDRVAGKAAAREHDEPVVTPDAVAPVRERVDAELELLSLSDGRGHRRPSLAPGYVMSRRRVRTNAATLATTAQPSETATERAHAEVWLAESTAPPSAAAGRYSATRSRSRSPSRTQQIGSRTKIHRSAPTNAPTWE